MALFVLHDNELPGAMFIHEAYLSILFPYVANNAIEISKLCLLCVHVSPTGVDVLCMLSKEDFYFTENVSGPAKPVTFPL